MLLLVLQCTQESKVVIAKSSRRLTAIPSDPWEVTFIRLLVKINVMRTGLGRDNFWSNACRVHCRLSESLQLSRACCRQELGETTFRYKFHA